MADFLRKWCPVLLALPSIAAAYPDSNEPWPKDAPTLNEQQIDLVEKAALLTGTTVITYQYRSFDSEGAASNATIGLGASSTTKLAESMGFRTLTQNEYVLPHEMRTALRNIAAGHATNPFRMNATWWVAVERASRVDPAPDRAAIRKYAASYVRISALPHPDDIEKLPLSAQFKAEQIKTAQELKELAPQLDINGVLPNGLTVLVRALVLDNQELTEAALQLGADPNLCVLRTCPLLAAIAGKISARAVPLLLAKGADPNHADPAAGIALSALTYAMFHDKPVAIGELLLAKGADINGGQGEATPLMLAADAGSKDAVTWLQQHGADWFRMTPERPPRQALYFALLHSDRMSFAKWFHAQWLEELEKSHSQDWQAWIEQDGQRIPVTKKTIELQRRPFTFIIQMKPTSQMTLAVAATDKVFNEADRMTLPSDYARDGDIVSIIAVPAEEADGKSAFLMVNGATPGETGPWSPHVWNNEAGFRKFATEQPAGDGMEYTRPVTELIVGNDTVPIGKYAGKELFVVMGTSMNVGNYLLEYYHPQRVHIVFR